MEKIAWDGPKWGREDLFPANPDLADILGDMDLDFENFNFEDFLDSKFVDFQFPDLKICPAPAVSGNLGTWKSGNLEIWGPGNPEMRDPTSPKNTNYQNPNPFCPQCRQGLD